MKKGSVLKWFAVILGILSLLVLIVLIFSSCYAFTHEASDEPWRTEYGTKSENIDRLEIYTFASSKENQRLIGVVSDPDRIARYRNAYAWTDSMAICCDEDTRYIIYEYAGDECVGQSKYSSLLSGYNNFSFSAQQLWLILFS